MYVVASIKAIFRHQCPEMSFLRTKSKCPKNEENNMGSLLFHAAYGNTIVEMSHLVFDHVSVSVHHQHD